jgi:hypothetical protein
MFIKQCMLEVSVKLCFRVARYLTYCVRGSIGHATGLTIGWMPGNYCQYKAHLSLHPPVGEKPLDLGPSLEYILPLPSLQLLLLPLEQTSMVKFVFFLCGICFYSQ